MINCFYCGHDAVGLKATGFEVAIGVVEYKALCRDHWDTPNGEKTTPNGVKAQ